MKLRNKIWIAIGATALVTVALLAQGFGHRGPAGGPLALLAAPGTGGAALGPGGGVPGVPGLRAGVTRFLLAQYLELTDAQKQMLEGFRKDALQTLARERGKRIALRRAIWSGDTAAVDRLAEEIGTDVTGIIKDAAAKVAAFKATLTPEQQRKIDQLRQLIEQRRERLRKRLGAAGGSPQS